MSFDLVTRPHAALGEPASMRARALARARRRPAAMLGGLIVAFFVLVAIAAPLLTSHGPGTRVGAPFAHPSAAHPLGLDDGGVDVLGQLIWGARVSLLIGFAAAAVSMLVGGALGLLSGYFGGWVDTVLARVIDYFLVVPVLPLMIVVAAIWGPSVFHIIVIVGLLLWTTTARVVRAQVQSVRERVYVRRAEAIGAGHARIIVRHVLPQVGPLLIANTVLTVGVAIFAETALAFLGLGDPSAASWGAMIEAAFSGSAISAGAWWAIVPPGLCVAAVIIGCSLVGVSVEDALNPRLATSHLSRRTFRLIRDADD
jgi:peptide/nickel transport system permease protein